MCSLTHSIWIHHWKYRQYAWGCQIHITSTDKVNIYVCMSLIWCSTKIWWVQWPHIHLWHKKTSKPQWPPRGSLPANNTWEMIGDRISQEMLLAIYFCEGVSPLSHQQTSKTGSGQQIKQPHQGKQSRIPKRNQKMGKSSRSLEKNGKITPSALTSQSENSTNLDAFIVEQAQEVKWGKVNALLPIYDDFVAWRPVKVKHCH